MLAKRVLNKPLLIVKLKTSLHLKKISKWFALVVACRHDFLTFVSRFRQKSFVFK